MVYYAHSGPSDDGRDWQALKAHLEQVAALAAQMAEPLGLGKAASLAGLFHDLGKYTADFQKRLTGADVRVDHSTAGGWHVLQAVQGQDRLVAELIAYAILGHHAGLPDKRGIESALTERIAGFKSGSLDRVWETETTADLSGLMPGFSWEKTRERLAFQLAFCGRMLFSCLVDAGAWVETIPSGRTRSQTRVASLAEAWVETGDRPCFSPMPGVASLAGAWIELLHVFFGISIGISPISAMHCGAHGHVFGAKLPDLLCNGFLSTPMNVGMSCPIVFMVWCDLWQWIAQSSA
jgi:CRISPR-associated endonuclease Cas3-HD